VTRNAEPPGDRHVNAVGTALAALVRVARAEYSDSVIGASIDVDADIDSETANALVSELLSSTSTESVLRGSSRYVRQLVPSYAGASSAPRLRTDATYLVTGGLGGVGLVLARHLAILGARHLVLAVREDLPPRDTWNDIAQGSDLARRVHGVETIERLGATLRIVPVDIGDEQAVEQLLRAIDASGPPLRGIVHAAATVNFTLLDTMSADEIVRSARVKAGGAWHLHRHVESSRLDFFVCCSSIASVLGLAGDGSYAVANGFLDGLTHHRLASGSTANTVNWAGWQDIGRAQDAETRRMLEVLRREGIGTFDEGRGVEAFDQVVSGRVAQALVASIDRNALGASRWPKMQPELFAELCDAAVDDPPQLTPLSSFKADLLGASSETRLALIVRALQREVGVVLRLPPEHIDLGAPLGTLGLDSLMGLELRRRIEALTGLMLPATVVWSHPTVEALGAHLIERLYSQPSAPSPSFQLAPVVSALDAMSDDEALSALMGGER
jgi:myxalamid-type polyketide synthase MxaE and MxaD